MTTKSDVIQANTEALENIAKSNVAINGALGTATSEYNAYLYPCVEFDKLILDKIDEINVKKTQIVTLLTDNYNKLIINCGIATKDPGVSGISNGSFVPASAIKGDACLIGSTIVSVASTAVVAGTAVTFKYNCQVFIDGSGGVGVGTTEQCDVGARGEVRKETLYSFVRPYLENMTISADDWTGISPTDGPALETPGAGPVGVYTYVGIGTTNTGIGSSFGIGLEVFQYTDVNDPNSIHKTYSELIGYYYPISDPGCGTTITSAVQTLENEIITIRSGIATLISPANNARVLKLEPQTDVWWITKTQSSQSTTEANINSLNNDLNLLP